MDNIIIAGKKIQLGRPVSYITRNLWLGLLTEFDIYQFMMNDHKLLLFVARGAANYSPMHRSNIARRVEKVTQLPVVFYFDNLPTYERDRLVAKGVYFVVSNKFAFVPTLLANRRLIKEDIPIQLLPSTQYVLLFQLQRSILNGMTIKDISEIVPYKYVTIAKSVQQIAALGLADFEADCNRNKRLKFMPDARELWERSLPYLTNPIKHTGYIDEPISYGLKGGIEALSHYSMLVGEVFPTRVISVDECKDNKIKLSQFEDIQKVEIWKYPPIAEDGYVDRLSLYLTLRDDNDPRVQKELEIMINEMPW